MTRLRDVHAALERAAGILIELELLVCHSAFLRSPPSAAFLDFLLVALHDLGENVGLAQDQVLLGAELDLGAAVLGEDDLVTLLDVHLDVLAVFVPRAGADREDAPALRLLLGGVR